MTATIKRLGDDRGTSALELAILSPALLGMLALMIALGRTAAANQHVEGAAFSAARTASIQRTEGAAQGQAASTATTYLDQRGLSCQPQDVSVDTSGFAAAVGDPGQVEVSVTCTVPLQEVTGLIPIGEKTFTATAVSPIDSHRGRS